MLFMTIFSRARVFFILLSILVYTIYVPFETSSRVANVTNSLFFIFFFVALSIGFAFTILSIFSLAFFFIHFTLAFFIHFTLAFFIHFTLTLFTRSVKIVYAENFLLYAENFLLYAENFLRTKFCLKKQKYGQRTNFFTKLKKNFWPTKVFTLR